ncbi:MAG: SpoIIE family protein phosphatase [Deltaproteobacteria bacterium]|nr:SpoIIE family protein phosphatase [Deltaproteobacteria bacterium]
MAYKILIVDDDSSTRNLLKIYLSQWGYDCTLAEDGSHGWELYQRGSFDMVLTDWMMPGLQGPELCRKIRSHDKRGYTYIVICTVKDNVKNIVEGIESGADDYVTKPFDRNELKVRITAGERILRLEYTLEKNNERLQRNLTQAAISLESMLPAPCVTPPVYLNWMFRPAAYIGGDLFNVFALDDDRMSIFSIDVSGHGVASALFAVTLSNMLRPWGAAAGARGDGTRYGIDDLASPTVVAATLNERFQLKPPTDLYFTMFYGVYHRQERVLKWVRAGHPAPIHISKNDVVLLEDGDPPIGFLTDYEFTEFQSPLNPGDRLFLYTDGIIDVTSPTFMPFGVDRLKKRLLALSEVPLNEALSTFEKHIIDYRGSEDFDDDLSLLGVEVAESV